MSRYKDENNPNKQLEPTLPEALDPKLLDQRLEALKAEHNLANPESGGIAQTGYSAYGEKHREELNDEEKAIFLRILCEHGIVTYACRSIGRSRMTVYNHRKKDVEFSKMWDLALELGIEGLVDEAKRRAFAGSDLLMIFLLKHLKKDTFGEQTQKAPAGLSLDGLGNPKRLIIEWDNEEPSNQIEGSAQEIKDETHETEGS